MATVNDVCSLAAILSELCDDTDTNLPYILFGTKTLLQMCRKNVLQIIWILIYCQQRIFKKNADYFYAVRISILLADLSEIFVHIGNFF